MSDSDLVTAYLVGRIALVAKQRELDEAREAVERLIQDVQDETRDGGD